MKIFMVSGIMLFLLAATAGAEQTYTYGWEDGIGTVLGTFGNVGSVENTDEIVQSDTQAFIDVYQCVRPNSAHDDAIVWMTTVVAPVIVVATQPGVMRELRSSPELEASFLERTRAAVVRTALSALDLPHDTADL